MPETLPTLKSRGILVCGRQHSGNTVVSVLLGRVPGVYAQIDENAFFEHRPLVEKIRDPLQRARRVHELLGIENDVLREPALAHLRTLAEAHPALSALDLYVRGLDYCCSASSSSVWVQKATGYIFYGDDILTALPDAHMVYLVRNPFDLAASKKRRRPDQEHLWNTMVSWSHGIRVADGLTARFPDRFRTLRYEDLTRDSESTVRALLEFLHLPFDPACLDVPHVNKSESRYTLTGDGKGLSRDRVNYYTGVLGPSEVACLDLLSDRALLRRFYPDLPHYDKKPGRWTRVTAAALAAAGPARYAGDSFRRSARNPGHLIQRTWKRLRLLAGVGGK